MVEPLRRIAAAALDGEPGWSGPSAPPTFEWVDPAELLVEDDYQRALSERGQKLIRKIAGAWDWRRFKPPVVARTPEGLKVIDGQHTATAAASHPGVPKIPVMVVEAESLDDRAGAFLGHNRDRLQLTPCQLHHAALAAHEPEALAIETICGRAGVRILRVQPGDSRFAVNDTMAVGSIKTLVEKRGADVAERILRILGAASLAPIGAAHVKAVELLMTDDEYAGALDVEDLAPTIQRLGELGEREASVFASAHGLPYWRGLAITLFKKCRHVRRRAA